MADGNNGAISTEQPEIMTTPGAPHRWTKGQPSPNPGGRPRIPDDLRQTAQRLSLLGWKRLEEILRDPKADRGHILAAHRMATEYGYGKPVQRVEGTDGGALVVQIVTLTDAEYSEQDAPTAG
jgi:hypothetical protein